MDSTCCESTVAPAPLHLPGAASSWLSKDDLRAQPRRPDDGYRFAASAVRDRAGLH